MSCGTVLVRPTSCSQVTSSRLASSSKSARKLANKYAQRNAAARDHRWVAARGLKSVQNYDADFVMDTVAEELLKEMLGSDTFCKQVGMRVVLQRCSIGEPFRSYQISDKLLRSCRFLRSRD